MPQEQISVSRGNSKIGRIPSISLPPFETCAVDVPCSIPDANGKRPCYVDKAVIQYPRVREAYARNLRIWNADGGAYFEQLHSYLERRAPPFFRFHVSGDYPSTLYMYGTVETAATFPATKFLAFTKRHAWLPRVNRLPKNYTIVASHWPRGLWSEFVAPSILLERGYYSAFVQDGTETRAPSTAIECPGNCETCGLCWSLPTLKRNVIFGKH